MTLSSPHVAALQAAVEAAYRLSPPHVPRTLTVCHCNCCMTEEHRAEIIATPVRDLRPELIQEYSNPAHGVPPDPDDLSALLPRYMDLMAQDQPVDMNIFHA